MRAIDSRTERAMRRVSPIATSTERAFSPQSTVILDCGSVNFIDSKGAEKPRELHEIAVEQGIALHLSNLKDGVTEGLGR